MILIFSSLVLIKKSFYCLTKKFKRQMAIYCSKNKENTSHYPVTLNENNFLGNKKLSL